MSSSEKYIFNFKNNLKKNVDNTIVLCKYQKHICINQTKYSYLCVFSTTSLEAEKYNKVFTFVSQCSAECGLGVRTRGVLCLTNHISSLPLEGCGSERPTDSQACNNGPCENRIEWFTGPWSQVRPGQEVGPRWTGLPKVCLQVCTNGWRSCHVFI